MQGYMMIIKASGEQELKNFTSAIGLEPLREAVGGYIEVVPHFDTFVYNGRKVSCVAFVNEEGKILGLPYNKPAQVLWQNALGMAPNDYLVGDVAVVWGDTSFMNQL